MEQVMSMSRFIELQLDEGRSVAQVARTLGVPKAFVLEAQGQEQAREQPQPPVRAEHSVSPAATSTEVRRAEVVRLRALGLSARAIGKRLACGKSTVLRDLGILGVDSSRIKK